MGGMYVLAIVIYVAARIIRDRQGIDLGPHQQGNPGRVSPLSGSSWTVTAATT